MVAEKGSGKVASSTPKTATNSMVAKKADAAKGQMSISAFFKKPAQSAETRTPRPPERTNDSVTKSSADFGNDEPKKNLEPCFEESRSDLEVSCVDVVSATPTDTHMVPKESKKDDKEDDCVIVCEKEPVSKAIKKDQPVTSKSVKSTLDVNKSSKDREPKATKLSGMTKQQNTLHFSNQDPAKSATKPVKTRPPHPDGLDLNCKGDVIMIAEFTSKFRFTLEFQRSLRLEL
jgi:hypothetical protein